MLYNVTFHWTVVDCGALEDPTNGKVVIVHGTTFDQPAVYSCNEGYTLNGDARRTCTASGQWTGSAPSCDREWLSLVAIALQELSCVAVDCGDLEAPANGHVSTSQGTHFMDTGVYSCAPGYDLTGCPQQCVSPVAPGHVTLPSVPVSRLSQTNMI